MSTAKAGAEAAPAKKKRKLSKKMLIIVLAAVLVLGGGGGAGAYFMFFSGPSEPEPPTPGKVIPLEPITLNLADGHFLKLSFALQTTEDATETPDGSRALDIAIAVFSNRSVAELSSNTAREKAKEELKSKIIEAYEGNVMDIYLTEFVMQ